MLSVFGALNDKITITIRLNARIIHNYSLNFMKERTSHIAHSIIRVCSVVPLTLRLFTARIKMVSVIKMTRNKENQMNVDFTIYLIF